ncbi:unnamed protein product [Calypogeia fissa]
MMVQLFPLRHHVLHSGVGGKLPHHYNDDVANYYASLAKGLDNLERAAAADFMSFEFISSGIDLLRSAHSGALLLIETLRLPVSTNGEEWLNEYMDETVKLLDVCNVLKSAGSGLEQYQNLVESAIRAVDVPGNVRYQVHRGLHTLNACRQEMLQIETEHRILMETKIEAAGKLTVNLGDKHVENKFVKWNGFWGVLFALKNMTAYICRLLLCAVVYIGPIPALNAELVSVKSLWSASLVRLHQSVTEEIGKTQSGRKCPIMFSSDVELLEGALADLRTQLQPVMRGAGFRNDDGEKFRQTIQSLKKGSQKLQTGVETVDWHINDLFDEIVEGRNKLLNLFSASR